MHVDVSPNSGFFLLHYLGRLRTLTRVFKLVSSFLEPAVVHCARQVLPIFKSPIPDARGDGSHAMEVLTQGVTHVPRSDISELLIGLAMLVTLLVLAGLIFQAIGSARGARRFPLPGRLVNVGDHRLHIYCMGEGTPAVVMDSGFLATSLSWTFVQPAVARFTHACSYDRAGLGWSDAGPMPRSSRQIVEELRTRLLNAGVEGPIVLVGTPLVPSRYASLRAPIPATCGPGAR